MGIARIGSKHIRRKLRALPDFARTDPANVAGPTSIKQRLEKILSRHGILPNSLMMCPATRDLSDHDYFHLFMVTPQWRRLDEWIDGKFPGKNRRFIKTVMKILAQKPLLIEKGIAEIDKTLSLINERGYNPREILPFLYRYLGLLGQRRYADEGERLLNLSTVMREIMDRYEMMKETEALEGPDPGCVRETSRLFDFEKELVLEAEATTAHVLGNGSNQVTRLLRPLFPHMNQEL